MPIISVEGKPTLFFSTNDDDKSWRLKEKIIAILESYLQGLDDLYTFSSIKIPNIVGDPTEVDVAFSSISDPTEFFRFVQIRDREDTEGRPWIEQVIGQQKVLGISAATVVSTDKFSRYAVNLAPHENIQLRLLRPETSYNIKKWYQSDYIGVEGPLFEVIECSILVKSDNKIIEFRGDREKILQNNLLAPASIPNQYKVISLAKVFDIEVLHNPKYRNEILAKIPADGMFHKATIAKQYDTPYLYIKTEESQLGPENIGGNMKPVGAIVFRVMVAKHSLKAPITHKYKYLDAISKGKNAEVIIAEAEINHQLQYISLARHSCDGEKWKLGGAVFR